MRAVAPRLHAAARPFQHVVPQAGLARAGPGSLHTAPALSTALLGYIDAFRRQAQFPQHRCSLRPARRAGAVRLPTPLRRTRRRLPARPARTVCTFSSQSSPGGAGGKRISQNDFTEKAWEAVVSAPDIAREASQQVVETEHLFKALLEQPAGLARRIMSKAGADSTSLLEQTNAYIKRQPRISGKYEQVSCLHHRLFL